MRDKLPMMLSHDVARLLRKIRAIAIGKYTELLDVFLFQSGKQTRLRLLPHLLTAGPIPLAPPRNEAADNDLPGSERTFLHFESNAIGWSLTTLITCIVSATAPRFTIVTTL